jgi:hypothetical protein
VHVRYLVSEKALLYALRVTGKLQNDNKAGRQIPGTGENPDTAR